MQKILYIIPFICLCIFSVDGGEVWANEEISERDAADFINKVVGRALGIVNNDGASDEEKRKQLSECINEYLDVDRITKAVFSPMGYKDLSEEDKQKVKNYLKKYLLRFYAGEGKLSAMIHAKLLKYPVSEQKEKDFAVTTQFEKNSTPSAKIVWVTDGRKVFYVEIEGINQIITLRSEMKNAVGSHALMEYINSQ